MGGGMILGTMMAGSSALGSIGAGKAQERAYEAEAKQAEMEATAQETARRRELNDALAMQAVMFAAQGRTAGVGSTAAIQRGDIRQAGQDIDLIRAGGKSAGAGLRAAGHQAKMAGYGKALSGAGKDMFSMWSAGAFKGTK